MRTSPPTGVALSVSVLLVALLSVLPAVAETYLFSLDDEGRRDDVEVTSVEGVRYFRLSDIARTAGASRHWNPRTSKMTLAVGPHRISMTSDSQFVSVDGEALGLGRPVLFMRGSFWVPPAFVTDALGLVLNSTVFINDSGLAVSFTKLGAELSRVSLEERPDETVVVLLLNDRTQFAVRSRERGRIDVFLHGARLGEELTEERLNVEVGAEEEAPSDSLEVGSGERPAEATSDSTARGADASPTSGPVVFDGEGLVSSVTVENSEAGVAVVIRAVPSAGAFDARLMTEPYRIEVVVWSEGRGAIPSPLLRGSKHLLSPDVGRTQLDVAMRTVMVDPGHGGTDTGYVNSRGIAEKDVALAVAEDVARYLQGDGFYVFMTRSSDSNVPLKRRAEIANLAESDVFVSIHMGSWHSGGAGGFRVSYYSPAGEEIKDAGAAGTRGLRRVVPGARSDAVREIEWGASQERLEDDSRALARLVHDRMAAAVDLRDRGTGPADLSVLAGCSMPAILVEVAFLSNASDASLLESDEFRSSVARSIAQGVADFREMRRERDQ